MRKFIAATTLGLFLASGLVSAPAASAATVKTGVFCTKSGLTKKVGSKSYVCGKNPYVTPTKLTWMLKSCKDTYAIYKPVKAANDEMLNQANLFGYATLTDLGNALGGNEKKELDTLVSTLAQAQAKLAKDCKKGA